MMDDDSIHNVRYTDISQMAHVRWEQSKPNWDHSLTCTRSTSLSSSVNDPYHSLWTVISYSYDRPIYCTQTCHSFIEYGSALSGSCSTSISTNPLFEQPINQHVFSELKIHLTYKCTKTKSQNSNF